MNGGVGGSGVGELAVFGPLFQLSGGDVEGLVQTAAKGGVELSAGENWMKDLKPEEIKVLGEIIREYLG